MINRRHLIYKSRGICVLQQTHKFWEPSANSIKVFPRGQIAKYTFTFKSPRIVQIDNQRQKFAINYRIYDRDSDLTSTAL